ncbi:molybdopterin cofactor-binding domain-containing protein [Umezawaea sp. Da 62-37]|uniref:xanthine dehydrogenase family protein molybdopterin-binding subunit n=1 Tax=Umezawaea sp. Da 62-37 TaxID=3075927 RepID=UPI0028F6D370|nr:molybdopterin cofactor-binding domain-containing protein [Umezawaea sp. Da 62-37]WNV87929.1 molybdopterin cofactor-binding domain-containing protein [Umezawaea sp. Da 62-37]
MTTPPDHAAPTRRSFLTGLGVVAVGFAVGLPEVSAEAAGKPDSLLRIVRDPAALPAIPTPPPTASWLVLDEDDITLYSGRVELGTGVRTALSQIVCEELRYPVAELKYVQSDTYLVISQAGTYGSKSLQVGAPELRAAAATAYRELLRLAALEFKVDAAQVEARDGKFYYRNRSVEYSKLIKKTSSVLYTDSAAPLVAPAQYKVVGKNVQRLELPGKLDATFKYLADVTVPGMLHARVVRPPGRNATNPVITNLDRARAIPGFVDVVRDGRFIGVLATGQWAAARAASPTTGITVAWTNGPDLIPQATLPDALRDPANAYAPNTFDPPGQTVAATAFDSPTLQAKYFTPFYGHGMMGAPAAVADVRTAPDPATGIQATVWSSSQNVTDTQAVIASMLGLPTAAVRLRYEESSGCYGHSGSDDCAADAALLSKLAGKPVRVQWSRQDDFGWEPLSPAQAHDMAGKATSAGIQAFDHLAYLPTANSRPRGGNAGTALAATLQGALPANLPNSSFNQAGRNLPVTYTFAKRSRATLVKSFVSTGNAADGSAIPASPLTYRLPRSSAVRSLGGFSNSFANESFFDELVLSRGLDPLEERIKSLQPPGAYRAGAAIPFGATDGPSRAAYVCSLLRPFWAARPKTPGRGAGVAYQQYETTSAHAATYVEVQVDNGKVVVKKVVVVHDCGIVVNPDGVRNQIEGNVLQGISRTLKEEIGYTADRITTLTWQESTFTPGPSYEVIRFDEIPELQIIVVDRPDQPALGAGEPTHATVPGAIGNAVFAATGKRVRALPMTPARVLGS